MNFTSREKVRERGRETGGMKAFQSRLKTSDHNGVKNERERESSDYIYTHTHKEDASATPAKMGEEKRGD